MKENLEKNKNKEIEDMINKQSLVIRNRLKEEFEERLKLEIQKKKAEFEQKKADLVLEVQNRAKSLFS